MKAQHSSSFRPRASYACLVVFVLGCGKRGSLGPDEFALGATISGTTIELSGNYSGHTIDETSCTYHVDGNDLRFDITWTGHDDGCASGAGHPSPMMLKVECHGPRLAQGHYVVGGGVADAHGLMLLAGDVDASGAGSLTRVMQ